ncbi:NAD-binding protein [Halovulum marinum]|uniref:NAD-binding protein n=1 Tax=Halovulum marinum TaxID=2662447 RepID=UPI002D7848E7|nr:NAD-binding protein [Halovulum marinum]
MAELLARFGSRVPGIDISEQVAGRLADELAQVPIADDEDALRRAGLEHPDVAIAAIGEDLQPSILCAMNARLRC